MLLKGFRPNLIDCINLPKVLNNYMRRCKCTGGESNVGLVCEWDISFSLKDIFSYF